MWPIEVDPQTDHPEMHTPQPAFPWSEHGVRGGVTWFMCSCGTVFGFHPISERQARDAWESHQTEPTSD